MAIFVCEFCGKPIEVTDYQAKKYKHHFCDRQCSASWKSDQVKCKCSECGKEFTRRRSQSLAKNLFCSTECANVWRTRNILKHNESMKKDRVSVKCSQCGEELHIWPCKKKYIDEGKQKQVFCSKECRFKWDSEHFSGKGNPHYLGGSEERVCLNCGKIFIAPQHRLNTAKYCSRECKDEHFSNVVSKTKEFSEQRRQITIATLPKMLRSGTKPERMVKSYLDEHNINYIDQHPMYDRLVVDFFLPDQNTVIEVNGDFWHGHPDKYGEDVGKKPLKQVQIKNKNKDIMREKILTEHGHKLYFVWECDIYADVECALGFLNN